MGLRTHWVKATMVQLQTFTLPSMWKTVLNHPTEVVLINVRGDFRASALMAAIFVLKASKDQGPGLGLQGVTNNKYCWFLWQLSSSENPLSSLIAFSERNSPSTERSLSSISDRIKAHSSMNASFRESAPRDA
jgi:hypothetical protein